MIRALIYYKWRNKIYTPILHFFYKYNKLLHVSAKYVDIIKVLKNNI
jgi:hypothetical protein